MKQILVFVLFAGMLCWVMFSPIYKHVLIVRQAVLQKEVDYMLEIGANGDHGYIDSRMIEQSRLRLAAFGMRPERLEYEVYATDGRPADDPGQPLPRGTGLGLAISYPFERLFEIDRLIGLAPPSPDERMSAGGLKMGEYVP
jgi:hypothetical protein